MSSPSQATAQPFMNAQATGKAGFRIKVGLVFRAAARMGARGGMPGGLWDVSVGRLGKRNGHARLFILFNTNIYSTISVHYVASSNKNDSAYEYTLSPPVLSMIKPTSL